MRLKDRGLERRLKSLFVVGLFLTLGVLAFLTMCNMPCEDHTYAIDHDTLRKARNKAFWNNHFLSPHRDLQAKLFILILTGLNNMHERDALRQTWLNNIGSEVIFRFAIGVKSLDISTREKLERENTVHKDMLLLSTVSDSYQGLTNKVLEAMIWVDKTVDYEYLLKVDDDTFVRVSNLMSQLHHKPKERLYWGFFDGRANVKQGGKWQESDWNLCDKYLPYARGGGYVLSSDLVHFIASNHELLQQYLSEDVSVGTWLAPLKINRHHDQNFDTEFVSRGCLNSYIITHKQAVPNIRELYSNLNSLGRLCKTESVLRGSYEYNWSYPPSKCCLRPSVKSDVNVINSLVAKKNR